MLLTKEQIKREHYKTVQSIMDYAYVQLNANVSLNDGIRKFSKLNRAIYLRKFYNRSKKLSFCSFIPTSNGASNIFDELIEFNINFNPEDESFNSYATRVQATTLQRLFKNLKHLPFYKFIKEEVVKINGNNYSLDEKRLYISELLIKKMKIKETPKVLQMFYKRGEDCHTAFEEHISLHQSLSESFASHQVHFTIDAQHQNQFVKALNKIDSEVKYPIEFSYEKINNQALCVGRYNNLIEKSNGEVLRKSKGHGILLENLNMIEEDIIYITNIDNFFDEWLKENLILQRKANIGYLIYLKDTIHSYLTKIAQKNFTKRDLKRLHKFMSKNLYLDLDKYLETSNDNLMLTIANILNRPIRVCSVVKSKQGEGDIPFWVKNKNGLCELQIVHPNEINSEEPDQNLIKNLSEYTIPIEMSCSLINFKGEKFNLYDFADPNAEILIKENYKHEEIKHLNAPGLWNGSMRNWLTFFVEIDNLFSPIKSLADLMDSPHCQK